MRLVRAFSNECTPIRRHHFHVSRRLLFKPCSSMLRQWLGFDASDPCDGVHGRSRGFRPGVVEGVVDGEREAVLGVAGDGCECMAAQAAASGSTGAGCHHHPLRPLCARHTWKSHRRCFKVRGEHLGLAMHASCGTITLELSHTSPERPRGGAWCEPRSGRNTSESSSVMQRVCWRNILLQTALG